MEKIPFSVELWKSGKYDAITRNDIKIKSLLIHDVDCNYPLSAVDEHGTSETYTITGNCHKGGGVYEKDLFLIPRKRKLWINIGSKNVNGQYYTSCAFTSKESLIEAFSDVRPLTIVKVEIDECDIN